MSRAYKIVKEKDNVRFEFLGIERDKSTVAMVRMDDPGREQRKKLYRELAEKQLPLIEKDYDA